MVETEVRKGEKTWNTPQVSSHVHEPELASAIQDNDMYTCVTCFVNVQVIS